MENLKNSLQKAIKKMGVGSKVLENTILMTWDKIQDDKLRKHTQAVFFRDNILFINVDTSAWMQQLYFLKNKLKNNLNKELGGHIVKDLRFKVGKVEKRQQTKEEDHRELKDIEISESELSDIKANIEGVEDERLRASLERLMIGNRRLRKKRSEEGWKPCPYCDSLYDPRLKKCPYCQVEGDVFRLLLGNPYLTYEECSRQITSILPEQYDTIKGKLINQLQRKIGSITFNQMFYAPTEKVKRYLHLVQSYVVLRSKKDMFSINDDDFLDILGEEKMNQYLFLLEKLEKGG